MEEIGRYRVQEVIARGGMGIVHRALAPDGSPAAVKLLLAGRAASPAQRQRFEREVQALLRLRHPRVVRLLDAGEAMGAPWLATEWVEGESLAERLTRGGPLEPTQAARIVAELARGVEHCHAAVVLHRDIKPANVLLRVGTGEPLLVDFGLARDLEPEESQGQRLSRGGLLGTPGFWAPEQARGELDAIGPRSDVWGLGALLYALLTGEPPGGQTLPEVLAALDRPPPPPRTLRPELPRELDAVCRRALALDPGQRHPSAAALAGELEGWLLAAAPAGTWRGPAALASAGALILAGVAWLGQGGAPLPRAEPPAPPPAPGSTAAVVSPGVDPAGRRTAELLAEARAAWRASVLDRARERADAALALAAPRVPAAGWLVRGLVHLDRGEAQGAADAAAQALAASQDPAERALASGLSAHAREAHEEARLELARACELSPADPDAAFLHGRALLATQQVAAAEAAFGRALELDPGFARAWSQRGAARGLRQDHQGAIEDLTRALELDPRDALAWHQRGLARRSIDDAAGAEDDATRALALAPGQVAMWHARGNARRARKDYPGALADYSRALELDPGHAWAWTNRGLTRERMGDLRGAVADYTGALEVVPEWVAAWIRRGAARLELDDPGGAAADLTRALELDPRSAEAHHRRALARERLGDLPGAVADLEQATRLYPFDATELPELRARLGRLQAR